MTHATYTVTKWISYENNNCRKSCDHFALLRFAGGITSFLKWVYNSWSAIILITFHGLVQCLTIQTTYWFFHFPNCRSVFWLKSLPIAFCRLKNSLEIKNQYEKLVFDDPANFYEERNSKRHETRKHHLALLKMQNLKPASIKSSNLKKRQAYYIAPLQPPILAAFRPWGGWAGAGRVRPASCKYKKNALL